MSTEGETSVFGTDGKLLYTMNSFTGRQEVFLSADGKVLVLDGGQYFGSRFLRPSRMEPDEVVSTIYLNGALWREVRYATDLNGGVPIGQGDGEPAMEIGGGWLSRNDYISELVPDWERNVLIYKMRNDTKEIELPPQA